MRTSPQAKPHAKRAIIFAVNLKYPQLDSKDLKLLCRAVDKWQDDKVPGLIAHPSFPHGMISQYIKLKEHNASTGLED